MMNSLLFLCFALGALALFQPALNRLVFAERGISLGLWLNSAVFFLSATLFLLFVSLRKSAITVPELLPRGYFQWWQILPGLCGLAIVLTVPLMMKNLGAFSTVIAMLAGQIITSFAWDLFFLEKSFSAYRFLGLVFAIVGAYCAFRPSA